MGGHLYMECLVCGRIKMIKEGTNPYFVVELQTGYVVLGDFQRFHGYTIFLCKSIVQNYIIYLMITK